MTYSYGQSSSGRDGALIAIVIAIVMIIPLVMFNGLVIATLWNWFVPQAFVGVPRITVGVGIGLSLVAEAIVGKGTKMDAHDEGSPLVRVFSLVFGQLLTGVILLSTGYIVHSMI